MSENRTDWSYVRPLCTFCNIFAILPPHLFGDRKSPVPYYFKFYTTIHILLSAATFFYSRYGREAFLYDNMAVIVSVTDQLAHLFMAVLNTFLRVLFVFSKKTLIKNFFDDAHYISQKKEFRCLTKRNFNFQFLAINAYLIFLIIFDAWVWNSTLGFEIFRYYIDRSYTYYICNMTVFFIFHCAFLIKRLFASLGDHVEEVIKNLVTRNRVGYILTEFKVRTVTESRYGPCDLIKIRRYYNKICDLVDNFNRSFGSAILLVIIFIISYILNLTDLLLVYAVSKSKQIKGSQYGSDLIILCFLWMITLLVFVFLLAHSCANAVSQSEKVAVICLNWLNEIPAFPKTSYEQILKEEIGLLVQLVTLRKPKFSAAGFFVVDFTLLGFILGSVTSYVIVSMQFI